MSTIGEDQKVIKGNIIKAKYRVKYKANGCMSCGDLIADELTAYTTTKKAGKQCVDVALLKQVAEMNGVWKDSYAHLNAGQQRMTIGNRLRKKYKDGDRLDIGGVPVYDPDLQLDEAA